MQVIDTRNKKQHTGTESVTKTDFGNLTQWFVYSLGFKIAQTVCLLKKPLQTYI